MFAGNLSAAVVDMSNRWMGRLNSVILKAGSECCSFRRFTPISDSQNPGLRCWFEAMLIHVRGLQIQTEPPEQLQTQ